MQSTDNRLFYCGFIFMNCKSYFILFSLDQDVSLDFLFCRCKNFRIFIYICTPKNKHEP